MPLVVSLLDSDGRYEKFGSVFTFAVVLELFSLLFGKFEMEKSYKLDVRTTL